MYAMAAESGSTQRRDELAQGWLDNIPEMAAAAAAAAGSIVAAADSTAAAERPQLAAVLRMGVVMIVCTDPAGSEAVDTSEVAVSGRHQV